MAEQLALEQLGGDRGAVQADERLAGALAVLVDRLGDQLLAGAVLADDEHVRVGRRHHAHQAEQLLHHVALRDELGKGRRALERRLQPAVLLDEGDPLADLVEQRREVPGVDRLLEEAEGAARHRPHRGADAAVAGDHDGLDVRMVAAGVVEQLHAVGVGQDHVEEDDVGGPARERLAVGRAGGDLPHRVASAGQQDGDPGAAVDVVVEDEDAKRRGGQLTHQGHGEPTRLRTRAIGYPAHRWLERRIGFEDMAARARPGRARCPISGHCRVHRPNAHVMPGDWSITPEMGVGCPSRAVRCPRLGKAAVLWSGGLARRRSPRRLRGQKTRATENRSSPGRRRRQERRRRPRHGARVEGRVRQPDGVGNRRDDDDRGHRQRRRRRQQQPQGRARAAGASIGGRRAPPAAARRAAASSTTSLMRLAVVR